MKKLGLVILVLAHAGLAFADGQAEALKRLDHWISEQTQKVEKEYPAENGRRQAFNDRLANLNRVVTFLKSSEKDAVKDRENKAAAVEIIHGLPRENQAEFEKELKLLLHFTGPVGERAASLLLSLELDKPAAAKAGEPTRASAPLTLINLDSEKQLATELSGLKELRQSCPTPDAFGLRQEEYRTKLRDGQRMYQEADDLQRRRRHELDQAIERRVRARSELSRSIQDANKVLGDIPAELERLHHDMYELEQEFRKALKEIFVIEIASEHYKTTSNAYYFMGQSMVGDAAYTGEASSPITLGKSAATAVPISVKKLTQEPIAELAEAKHDKLFGEGTDAKGFSPVNAEGDAVFRKLFPRWQDKNFYGTENGAPFRFGAVNRARLKELDVLRDKARDWEKRWARLMELRDSNFSVEHRKAFLAAEKAESEAARAAATAHEEYNSAATAVNRIRSEDVERWDHALKALSACNHDLERADVEVSRAPAVLGPADVRDLRRNYRGVVDRFKELPAPTPKPSAEKPSH